MWLIAESELKTIRGFSSSDILEASKAFALGERSPSSPDLQVEGGAAKIQIVGPLTARPSFWGMLFGGGSDYQTIGAQLRAAAENPAVKRIDLFFDSPGGEVSGLFDLIDTIKAISLQKKFSVTAAQAQSAAYGIAAATGAKIVPTSAGAVFGSVGVMAQIGIDSESVIVTSTDAPDKAPDVSTDEGKAKFREYLDQVHEAFVGAIAEGRSMATGNKIGGAYVSKNYGRGASMLAAQALEAGLIDAKPKAIKRRAMSAQQSTNGELMKFSEFAAAHPEEAKAAINAAKAEERERCAAHIKLAEKSGAFSAAAAAICGGVSASDPSVLYEHIEHGLKSKAQIEHQRESDSVESAISGLTETTKATSADMGDLVAEAVLGKAGL